MSTAVNPEPAVPLSKEAQELADLRKKFEKLKVQGPVRIDAFISTEVPESYVQPRINLLNVLREFKIEGGDMVELNTHNMLRGDPLAEVAKTRYNIVAREVFDNHGGTYKREKIFLGVAFTCGLQKVIVPFLNEGCPPNTSLSGSARSRGRSRSGSGSAFWRPAPTSSTRWKWVPPGCSWKN